MKRWLRFKRYLLCLDDIRGADRLQVGTGNPGCFLLNSNTIAMKHKDGYNQCVVIFDMDPLSNNEFVTYAPVVWCAEISRCHRSE